MSTFEDEYPYLVYSSKKDATFEESSGGGGSYTLPTASADTLGGVKVGSGLAIDADGVLSASGGSGGSGSIRVLEIEYPTPENPTLNASYNDLVGMAEAGEVAVIFYDNAPLMLSYLIQDGETVEEMIYTANFRSLDSVAYTFTCYDANQPMPMV